MNDPPDPAAKEPGPGPGPEVVSFATIAVPNNVSFKDSLLEIESTPQKKRRRKRNEIITKDETSVDHINIISEQSQIEIKQSNLINEARSQYLSSDAYPYVVHVQRIETSVNDGSTLHPITFGRFLKTNNVRNVVSGSVKKIGRNRCTVAFATAQDANDFIFNKNLEKNKLKAKIPTFNITRIGLVKGIPPEWSPEEIVENLSTPSGCGKIIKVRRLNYKVFENGTIIWKPTQSVVLTFDGQCLPPRIFVCYNSLPVSLYIFPTIQCYNCCRYGHTKSVCRSKPRCFKCGQDHSGDTCSVEEDCASCLMCSGFHYATNKICPEFNRQKNIKITMSQKNISYGEASRLHPQATKSYGDVLVSPPPPRTIDNISKNVSYKKTVFLKPRNPPKRVGGDNNSVHKSLIKDFQIPSPENGCAISQSGEIKELIESFSNLLDTLLSKHNLKPSHVANLNKIIEKINNNYGCQDNTMELQKCNLQEN